MIMEGKKPSPLPSSSGRPNTNIENNVDPKDDMKKILMAFNGGSKKQELVENKVPERNIESNLSQDELVDKIIRGEINPTQNKSNFEENLKEDNFQIVVELYPASKIRKLYSIVNNGNPTEYNNFQMFETAQLIIESLQTNKKSKIDFYKEKDREFSNLIKESLFYKSKIEKCRQINEKEAERIIAEKSKNYSLEAQKIQKEMRNLISLF